MGEKVDKIHTPCRNCIFATYDGKRQTGCKLNRIEAFRQLDNIIDAKDKNRKFFIVNKRVCNAFNTKESDFAKAFRPDDQVEAIRKMLSLRLSVLIVLNCEADFEGLRQTNEAMLKQSLKPHQIIFINNQAVVKPAEFQASLFKQLGNQVTWRINQIVERAKDGSFVTPERAIDHAMVVVNGGYYSVIKPGFVPYVNFVRDIDVALNERMERFSLLLPTDDGNGLTVQTELHKHPQINGNMQMIYHLDENKSLLLSTITEKITHYAKLENKPYLVKKVQDVCPSL